MSIWAELPAQTKFDGDSCAYDKAESVEARTLNEEDLETVKGEIGEAAVWRLLEGMPYELRCAGHEGVTCPFSALLRSQARADNTSVSITNETCIRKSY